MTDVADEQAAQEDRTRLEGGGEPCLCEAYARATERAALAACATESSDGIPADVIGLVAAGQKIRAIKRYRELTGVELKEARVIIDRL